MNQRCLSRTSGAPGLGAAFFFLFYALAAPASALAAVFLSEVYYDAPGSDDGAVFVELAGPAGFVLDGWVVEGVNGSNGAVGPSIVLDGAIGSGGLFVLADRISDGTTTVANASQLANFDFQNGPDSVVLRDSAAQVRDALGYGVFAPDEVFAGEGAAAPDGAAGESLARRFANVDTDDNAADYVLGTPSPGAAPFAVVPEPGAALLLGLGLAGLARVEPRAGSSRRADGSAMGR
ncbi:MAG: lamin tail domain-containing protein [Myxococcota bacterium]